MVDKNLMAKMISDYEEVIKTATKKMEELKKRAKENDIEVSEVLEPEEEKVEVEDETVKEIERKRQDVFSNIQKMRENSMAKIKRIVEEAQAKAKESMDLANSAQTQGAMMGKNLPNIEEMKSAMLENSKKTEETE